MDSIRFNNFVFFKTIFYLIIQKKIDTFKIEL
jgi:hypothetical protein